MPIHPRRRPRPHLRPIPRPCFSEPLEPRLLLATVSGVKWNDADGDGRRGPFDLGLGGWTIYLDLNANGSLDRTEPSDLTDANGAYSITTTLTAGRVVRVREVPQAGWRPTSPADGEHTIAFPASSVSGVNFGNTRRGLLTGTTFNDLNDNGAWDFGERGLGGWTVFADTDNDGVLGVREPSTTTDAAGNYALSLPAGTHTVRQVDQAGWWRTLPAGGAHAVTLADGQTLSGRNFGNIAAMYDLLGAALVVNSAILPVPADGGIDLEYAVRNDGTAPSPSFSVAFYLSDDDTISTADTLLRTVSWSSVPRHDTVTRTLSITLPRPDPFRTDNESFVGMIVDSANAVAETDETNNRNRGLALDRFPLSPEGDLPRPVDNTSVRARPLALGTAVNSAIGDEWIGAYDQDIYRFTVEAGHKLVFSLSPFGLNGKLRLYNAAWSALPSPGSSQPYTIPATGTYYLVVSAGDNNTGDPRRLTGRTAGPTGDYTLKITDVSPDLRGAISSWTSSPTAPIRISFRIEGERLTSGPFTLAVGDFDVSFYLSDDEQVSTADRFLTRARVTSSDFNFDFGSFGSSVEFTLPAPDPYRTDNRYWVGMIVDSANEIPESDETNNANRPGVTDSVSFRSEADLPGPTDGLGASPSLFLSLGRASAAAIGDEWIGAYDQDISRIVANANETIQFDLDRTGGTLDSHLRLFDDAWTLIDANDNAAAPGEAAGLDSYLRHTFTAAGTYYLVVSARGNHTSNPLLLTGRTAASTGAYDLTAISEPAGDVTGTVFDDANANGVRDAGEPGLAGWTVFLDARDDALFFPTIDPNAVTDAAGAFVLSGIRPDSYVLRLVPQAGWLGTAPAGGAFALALASGQPAGPMDFAVVRQVTASGAAFDDVNGNAARDAGETGLAGRVIYADLNNNGVRDLRTVTINSTDVPRELRASSVTRSHLDVTGLAPTFIADVDVAFVTNDQHFVATLLRPSGGSARLITVPDLNFGQRQYAFDDEANPPGPAQQAEEPLSVFDGGAPDGRWTLAIQDRRSGSFPPPPPRTLYGWSLTLTVSEPYTLTAADGTYTLAGLLPGEHHVRAETQPDWIATAPPDGAYARTLVDGGSAAGLDFGARQRQLQVTARHVFYNHSAFDGRDPAANAADDAAVATDKTPLAAGGTRSPANMTGYTKGLNGIMIDVAELLTAPTLADFSFKVPSSFDPSLWLEAPAATGFAVRDLPGPDHNRRVTFTWPDGMLRNVWLQVSTLASAATRRLAPDVFYFGNLIGETGGAPTPTRVSAADLAATRAAVSRARAGVDNAFDHNRDGWVNVRDLAVVRSNLGHALSPPVLPVAAQASILPPPPPPQPRATRPPPRTGWTSDLLDE